MMRRVALTSVPLIKSVLRCIRKRHAGRAANLPEHRRIYIQFPHERFADQLRPACMERLAEPVWILSIPSVASRMSLGAGRRSRASQ